MRISMYTFLQKYVNMNFLAFYPKFHAYFQQDHRNTNRNTVSLKCRKSYRKLICHRSCFKCIEIIRIWLFWCIVTWLSLTLWCKKNLLSVLLWLQITTDPYFKTVTISTYDRYPNLTPWKLDFLQFLQPFWHEILRGATLGLL